jgi:hypothetical protein
MSGYGLPVLGRQIAPGLETGNPVVIKSQDGRPVGASGAEQSVDRGLINLLQSPSFQERQEQPNLRVAAQV